MGHFFVFHLGVDGQREDVVGEADGFGHAAAGPGDPFVGLLLVDGFGVIDHRGDALRT